MSRRVTLLGVSRVTSIIGVVGLVLALTFFFFTTICACSKATPKKLGISSLKQIAVMHSMYATDFDGFGPSPETWADQLLPYVKRKELFLFPEIPLASPDSGKFGYAYYRPLGGVHLDEVQNPEEVPLAFDSSDLRWNANGDLSLLPDPPRWDGKNHIAFLDTHVKAVEGRPRVEIKLP